MTGNKFLFGLVITAILLSCVPASASEEYTLGIFGNANEDDTINIQDMTYTEQIILEYNDGTQLADAKYDGEINILDMTQIELIILGMEKELTFEDNLKEPVTINKPIERIAVLHRLTGTQIMQILDLTDEVVCVSRYVKENEEIFPELSQVSGCGDLWGPPDWEAILDSKPDVVFTYVYASGGEFDEVVLTYGGEDHRDNLAGIPIVALCVMNSDRLSENMRKLGYIFDRKDDAEEFIDWYEELANMLEANTKGLSEDEKTLYWFSHYGDVAIRPWDDLIGGKNIATKEAVYDIEWIIEQNPEVIIMETSPRGTDYGYLTDDTSGYKAVKDEIISRPGFSEIGAVKNDRVYMIDCNSFLGGPGELVELVYITKALHPDLSKDLDPRHIHQEFLTKLGVDYNVSEHGVFVYPISK